MRSETNMNRRGFIAATSIVGAVELTGAAPIEAFATDHPGGDQRRCRSFFEHDRPHSSSTVQAHIFWNMPIRTVAPIRVAMSRRTRCDERGAA